METQQEGFQISKTLLNELKNEARQKHETLSKFMNNFLEAILFVNWEEVQSMKGMEDICADCRSGMAMAEYCGHCPENPTAKKPLAKVKKVSIDTNIYNKIVTNLEQIRAA